MRRAAYALTLFILLCFLVSAAVALRAFGEPTRMNMDRYFIEHGQEETGANNIVSSVVFDYRGFDTLGEATVLFSAVTAVVMLLSKSSEGGRP